MILLHIQVSISALSRTGAQDNFVQNKEMSVKLSASLHRPMFIPYFFGYKIEFFPL